jgi:hypothetical protein
MCFWGFQHKNLYLGSYFPKRPHFWAGIGISSLNVESNTFRTARPILVNRSSNDASPQKEFKYRSKLLKFVFWGSYYKKPPKREFPSQNIPFYNFLTTQPIHTNSNSIDAARQVKHQTKLKHIKNFHLGDQF